MKRIFLLLTLWMLPLSAHEGHHIAHAASWSQWIGGFHLIFLHFPIALIVMVTFAEIAFMISPKPMYVYASRFMLASAAIFAIPTALLGLIYSYASIYEGEQATFLFWHMWLGLATALLTLFVFLLRETYGPTKTFYVALLTLFLVVNVTAFFGGLLTFGLQQLIPPA